MRKIFLVIMIFIGICFVTNADGQSMVTNGTGTMANSVVGTNRPISRLYDDPDLQKMIDSMDKGAETNGLVCAIYVSRPSGAKDLLPTICVNVINTTTSWVHGGLNLPREVLFKIKMYDSHGVEVKRTKEGERFEDWSQGQIEEWFREQVRLRRKGRWIDVAPLNYAQVGGRISLPELFQLEEAGEYTLHLRMPLIQVQKKASGKFIYKTTWLPEVVAKVQILPEDIASLKSPNIQSNSPTR